MGQKDAINKLSASFGGSSFLVRIHFRQNSSWQGTIQWLDGKKTMPFRSILEMLMLMQDAIKTSGTAESRIEFRSWDDKEEVS